MKKFLFFASFLFFTACVCVFENNRSNLLDKRDTPSIIATIPLSSGIKLVRSEGYHPPFFGQPTLEFSVSELLGSTNGEVYYNPNSNYIRFFKLENGRLIFADYKFREGGVQYNIVGNNFIVYKSELSFRGKIFMWWALTWISVVCGLIFLVGFFKPQLLLAD